LIEKYTKPFGYRLNSSDPYDSICAHIGNVLAPYFKSVVHGKFRDKQESDKLIPSIEKNLNDAEVALLHLKQNIDIPDVELAINPKIQAAVERARSNGTKTSVSDLGDDVSIERNVNGEQHSMSSHSDSNEGVYNEDD
jgi:dynein heavy chain 1